MNVVIPLGRGSKWHNNELRYALRSLEKHALDLSSVTVIGRKPFWASSELREIPGMDRFARKNWNVAHKWHVAARKFPGPFIWSNDDIFLTKDVKLAELPLYYNDTLAALIERLQANYGLYGTYIKILRATRIALLKMAGTEHEDCEHDEPLNFECHYPTPVVGAEILANPIWRTTHGRGFATRSLWGNHPSSRPWKREAKTDFKLVHAYRPEDLIRVRLNGMFSVGDGFIQGGGADMIASLYPEPSVFESKNPLHFRA